MPYLAGRFYLKKTTSENLIGEFSNDKSGEVFTEGAVLQPGKPDLAEKDRFSGSYKSTWLELGKPRMATLVIRHTHKLFTLEWTDNTQVIFEGSGMLCDDILIGDYRVTP